MLEAKASRYRQARYRRKRDLTRAALTISKTGDVLRDLPTADDNERAADQALVTVTKANRQVYYQGYHVSMPATFGGRQFYRTITDDEFLLSDIETGQVLFSFPLPLVALQVRGRYIPSYTVRGVQMENPTKHWARLHAEHLAEFEHRQGTLPEVLTIE